MATAMSRRERVSRAIRGEEVDRIPTYDILVNDAVIEYYSGQQLTVENGMKVKAAAIARCLDMTRGIQGRQDSLLRPSPSAQLTSPSPDINFVKNTVLSTKWVISTP